MIAVVFAVTSGLAFGAADFSGAVASKRTSALTATLAMQIVSLVATIAVLAATASEVRLSGHSMIWAATAGIGTAVGLALFYRALAIGPMVTAAGITALVGSSIPVAVGIALGDRPSAARMLGVALCIPAGFLLATADDSSEGAHLTNPALRDRSRLKRRTRMTRRLSVVAGIGFGWYYVAMSRISESAGLFPLVGVRAGAIAVLCLALIVSRTRPQIARESRRPILLAGILDLVANASYLSAVTLGSLTWVAPISSLYPTSTVLLARIVYGERLARSHIGGLTLSVLAVVLIAIG